MRECLATLLAQLESPQWIRVHQGDNNVLTHGVRVIFKIFFIQKFNVFLKEGIQLVFPLDIIENPSKS